MKATTALPLLLAASGVVALASSVGTWFTSTTTTVTGDIPLTVTGGAVPVVGAAGLVLLAGAAALLLARRSLARVVGGLAGLLAAGAAVVVVMTIVDPSPQVNEAAIAATGIAWSGGAIGTHPPAWAALGGLVLGALAGVGVAVVGGRKDGATRFDRGSREGEEATSNPDTRVRAMDDWDAIGRGEDPSENGGRLGS